MSSTVIAPSERAATSDANVSRNVWLGASGSSGVARRSLMGGSAAVTAPDRTSDPRMETMPVRASDRVRIIVASSPFRVELTAPMLVPALARRIVADRARAHIGSRGDRHAADTDIVAGTDRWPGPPGREAGRRGSPG